MVWGVIKNLVGIFLSQYYTELKSYHADCQIKSLWNYLKEPQSMISRLIWTMYIYSSEAIPVYSIFKIQIICYSMAHHQSKLTLIDFRWAMMKETDVVYLSVK